jgi:hypothetical protein
MNSTGNRKRVVTKKYAEVNEQVRKRCSYIRNRGLPVSGPLLRSIAFKVLKDLRDDENIQPEIKEKYHNASFNTSWLDAFKLDHDLRKVRINGERAALTINLEELMDPIRNTIASLNIPIFRIWNWDETGLFYRNRFVLSLDSHLYFGRDRRYWCWS